MIITTVYTTKRTDPSAGGVWAAIGVAALVIAATALVVLTPGIPDEAILYSCAAVMVTNGQFCLAA